MGVCANPGVCDFTYTFTHHSAKRSRTAIIAMDLHRKSLERAPRSTWWRTSRVHDPSRVARRAAAAGYNLRRPLRRGREFKTLVGVSLSARGMHVNAPRPFASVLIPFMEGGRSGVRGYALSGGHQTVHSVWGYACRAFRSPNHTLTPTYSKSWAQFRKKVS